MTLVEFLLARFDEQAREADDIHERGWCESLDPMAPAPCNCGAPLRVLHEVEVKRLIVEESVTAGDESALRLLALPYTARADYDEGWRP